MRAVVATIFFVILGGLVGLALSLSNLPAQAGGFKEVVMGLVITFGFVVGLIAGLTLSGSGQIHIRF